MTARVEEQEKLEVGVGPHAAIQLEVSMREVYRQLQAHSVSRGIVHSDPRNPELTGAYSR